MPSSASKTLIISRCTIKPDQTSTIKDLKLSVSDLPMLSCHYIQKGVLLTRHDNIPFDSLIPLLKLSLAKTLSHFPALAGRMKTDSSGFVHIDCNDLGVDFVEANATHLSIRDVLPPHNQHSNDVPAVVKEFFTYDGVVSYEGHFKPLAAVQVTELFDGVFIGCAVNHAVTDGTSFWNFFNIFAEITKGAKKITKQPDFTRNYVKDSQAVLRFPDGNPKVTFDVDAPLRERIFHFSRESILKLKSKANNFKKFENGYEVIGKLSNDQNQNPNGKVTTAPVNPTVEISSFQSLSAQLWRSVTRARKLPGSKPTTFRMAVNCRHRLEPRIDPYYFGNAIQSIPTIAPVGELLSRDLCWGAEMLNKNVRAHNHDTVVQGVEEWEKNPRCFPLGNFDGASITMGSSPRFPMYDNDFGWGRPLAVRSGKANKFDGKISAFPGRDGGGSVDLEVCLSPDTMSGLENDTEFMQYVTDML
ncbi:hypothetical protein MKW94_022579 [Papaver nudicaule]|uniref:BAHD acyltransferase DCR n=1 Tax=Papaver nudicaule TaxID=74823 RepID=A0AA42B434_PAPNU|nr:hypothetical protein [Papaver nudicaule]MCL7050399.1 hypothetical protein [Papaver nudicaule]